MSEVGRQREQLPGHHQHHRHRRQVGEVVVVVVVVVAVVVVAATMGSAASGGRGRGTRRWESTATAGTPQEGGGAAPYHTIPYPAPPTRAVWCYTTAGLAWEYCAVPWC